MGGQLLGHQATAGKAPEGSGVPVGTQYHWYVIAHQIVSKLNANDYSTSLTGFKFKLAHKRADKETWSASTVARRRRPCKFFGKSPMNWNKRWSSRKRKSRHLDQ